MTRREGAGATGVHVIGVGSTPVLREHDAVLDELVFDAVASALAECGLRKQDVGLVVQASMDVYDARSISSGLTTSAAGGYLVDSYRIEGDSGQAVLAAAQAVAAGDVEVAVAVGVHNPEFSTGDPVAHAAFLDQVSSLAFEPVFDRPVGMTAIASWAMQAAAALADGAVTLEQMAAVAAHDITRGATSPRSVRAPATATEVLASPTVASPLSELMLPAAAAAAAAVVLASPERAARARGRRIVVDGLGHGTGDYVTGGRWLRDPAIATRNAARAAYGGDAAKPPESIELLEASIPTPFLRGPVLAALGLEGLPDDLVNPSGGLAAAYAGLANGVIRLIEAAERLEGRPGRKAVVHSTDTITGAVTSDATVLVLRSA